MIHCLSISLYTLYDMDPFISDNFMMSYFILHCKIVVLQSWSDSGLQNAPILSTLLSNTAILGLTYKYVQLF